MTIREDKEKHTVRLFFEVLDIIFFSALIGVSIIIAIIGFKILAIIDEILIYSIFASGFFLTFLLKLSLSSNSRYYFPVTLGKNFNFLTYTLFPIFLSATLATYIVVLISPKVQRKMLALITVLENQLNQVTSETLILLPVFIGAFIFATILGTQLKKYFDRSKAKFIYLISFFSVEMVFLITSTIIINIADRLNFDHLTAKVLSFIIIGIIPILCVKYLYFGGGKKIISGYINPTNDPLPYETFDEYQIRTMEKNWEKN